MRMNNLESIEENLIWSVITCCKTSFWRKNRSYSAWSWFYHWWSNFESQTVFKCLGFKTSSISSSHKDAFFFSELVFPIFFNLFTVNQPYTFFTSKWNVRFWKKLKMLCSLKELIMQGQSFDQFSNSTLSASCLELGDMRNFLDQGYSIGRACGGAIFLDNELDDLEVVHVIADVSSFTKG